MGQGIRTAIVSRSIVLAFGSAYPAAAQFYTQHHLVSDGAVSADLIDPNLVNAWGLVASTSSSWWVANNGTGTATLYAFDLTRFTGRGEFQHRGPLHSAAAGPTNTLFFTAGPFEEQHGLFGSLIVAR